MEPLAKPAAQCTHENSDCQCKQQKLQSFSLPAQELQSQELNLLILQRYSASPNPIVATTAPIAGGGSTISSQASQQFHNKTSDNKHNTYRDTTAQRRCMSFTGNNRTNTCYESGTRTQECRNIPSVIAIYRAYLSIK